MIKFTEDKPYSPLEAWSIYTALNLHFNPERDYDAVKYNFKGPKCTPEKFDSNNNKFLFQKLVQKYPKKNDYIGYCLANIIAGKKWITEYTDNTYNLWLGKIQALDYNFVEDIKRWREECPIMLSFNHCLVPKDPNEFPFIYKLYKEEKINLETLAILENLVHYINPLRMKINDPMGVAENLSHLIIKYAEFLIEPMNLDVYTDIIIKTFTPNQNIV